MSWPSSVQPVKRQKRYKLTIDFRKINTNKIILIYTAVYCPPITFPNGMVNYHIQPYWSLPPEGDRHPTFTTATFTCNFGYILNEHQTSTCINGVNGVGWTNPPTCRGNETKSNTNFICLFKITYHKNAFQ